MKKLIVGLVVFSMVLCFMAFAQEQNGKKYDARFSLVGGTLKGKFALNGNFAYARNFGNFFFQAAGMTNIRSAVANESGMSFGFGTQGEVVQFYVFMDGLYREKLWMQVRPYVRFDFNWLSIGGYYAMPLKSDEQKVGLLTISATPYFGGEFNLIPAPWLKFYGQINSIEGLSESYRVGFEIRPLNFISLTADWNKISGTYSTWNKYEEFRFALNLLFGAQQNTFRSSKPTGPTIIPVMYPILIAKNSSGKIVDTEGENPVGITFTENVTITYFRVAPYVSNDNLDGMVCLSMEVNEEKEVVSNLFDLWRPPQGKTMGKVSEKEFVYTVEKLPRNIKLAMFAPDPGRSKAGGPELNAKTFKLLGTELDSRFIKKDPFGIGQDFEYACFIITEGNIPIPWNR